MDGLYLNKLDLRATTAVHLRLTCVRGHMHGCGIGCSVRQGTDKAVSCPSTSVIPWHTLMFAPRQWAGMNLSAAREKRQGAGAPPARNEQTRPVCC